MLLGLLALVRALVELAEGEVAVGDEWPGTARLRDCECGTVERLASLGVEVVGSRSRA